MRSINVNVVNWMNMSIFSVLMEIHIYVRSNLVPMHVFKYFESN